MAMKKIGKFNLHNGGGFVARSKVAWMDDDGEQKLTTDVGDVTLGANQDVDLGSLNVPDGSIVSLYVFVVWGTDNEARQSFVYEKGNPTVAKYTITGTTLSNTLGLISVD